MNTNLTAAVVSASLLISVWLGTQIRRHLPQHHLNAETKDTVKLAMGLVATMTALVLGLLVSSAKSSYDTTRGEVIQMASKVAFLERLLLAYGPEAAEARTQFRSVIEGAVNEIWPKEGRSILQVSTNSQSGYAFYAALQGLSPKDEAQRALKNQASSLALELGQLRALLQAQSVPSVSKPMLVIVVSWLVIIFFSFSLLAPPNATANLALMVATVSVAGAIFLILGLDHPFGGLVRISSEPMLNALNQLVK